MIGKPKVKVKVNLQFGKLIVTSILTAISISLAMIGILKLIGFSINPAIAATVSVTGVAAYVMREFKGGSTVG